MGKTKETFVERRKYVRLQVPLGISYTLPGSGRVMQAATKNISADGARFETVDPELKENTVVEIKLEMPGASNPIHAKGTIIWRKRVSLEDGAPFDCGLEFIEIEEDNKNTFLKFLCDLIYGIGKEKRKD
jgi:c-di-GMP-binding flagellar brake protein YcgR